MNDHNQISLGLTDVMSYAIVAYQIINSKRPTAPRRLRLTVKSTMNRLETTMLRTANDQAIQLMATGRYDEAIAAFRSALRRFRDSSGDDDEMVIDRSDQLGWHRNDAIGVSVNSCLHPIPTSIMGPADESSCDVSRECFMVMEGLSLHENNANEVSESDLNVILSCLLFNLALGYHLRGICRRNPSDLRRAQEHYRSAIASGTDLVNDRMARRTATTNSTCWMLLLAISNNLGCIAAEAADHSTVQECISLGQTAMRFIDLPLFWSNQFTWCNPSAAA